jgi:hypothetical protein
MALKDGSNEFLQAKEEKTRNTKIIFSFFSISN